MLGASPRYLRASIRLGGRHDPEEREAERAASTIVAGGSHRVLDPGGSTHLRATGSDATGRHEADQPCTPAVVDPGASGRVRRAATHKAVDPGDSHGPCTSRERLRRPMYAACRAGASGAGLSRSRRCRRLRAFPTAPASDIDRVSAVGRAGGVDSTIPAVQVILRAFNRSGIRHTTACRAVGRARAFAARSGSADAAAAPPVVDRARRAGCAAHPRRSRVDRSTIPMTSAPQRATRTPRQRTGSRTARMSVGQPLPATVRARLEHGFGEPLANVRVDTSPTARAAAAAIGARAYTEGERITLGHGESEHDLRPDGARDDARRAEPAQLALSAGRRRQRRRNPPQGPAGRGLGFRRQPDLPHAGWPDDRIAGRHDGRRSPRTRRSPGWRRNGISVRDRRPSRFPMSTSPPKRPPRSQSSHRPKVAKGPHGEACRRPAFGRRQSPA